MHVATDLRVVPVLAGTEGDAGNLLGRLCRRSRAAAGRLCFAPGATRRGDSGAGGYGDAALGS